MLGNFALNGLLGWHKLPIVFNDLKGDILHTSIPTFAESILYLRPWAHTLLSKINMNQPTVSHNKFAYALWWSY